MKKTVYGIILPLLLLGLLLISTYFIHHVATFPALAYENLITHDGDLVINETQTFLLENCTFIQTGNVYVKDNGTLILRNCEFVLNQSDYYQFAIWVQDNGRLLSQNTNISSNFHFDQNFAGNSIVNFTRTFWKHFTWTYFSGQSLYVFDSRGLGHFWITTTGCFQDSEGTGFILTSETANILIKNSSMQFASITVRNSILNIAGLRGGQIEFFNTFNNISVTTGLLSNVTIMKSNIQLHFEPYNSNINFVNCDIEGFEARDGSNVTVSDSTVSDMHAEEDVELLIYNVSVPAHLAAWYNSRVIIHNSYISWLMIEEKATVSVYESTIYELSCSRLSTPAYLSNVTISYFSVSNSNFYLHGNLTFLNYVRGWEESSVVRNFNVILMNETGYPLANAEMKLYDRQNIVWNGTSDVHGRADFNVTYTDGNYTNTLVLKVIRDGRFGTRSIEFTSSTPVFLSVRLPPVHNLDSGLNYTTIQEAIDANETLDGHTIFVEKGTYLEHIIVNKRVKLLGENKNITIIDGQNKGTVFKVTIDGVSISGFMVVNCDYGIYLYSSNRCNISSNRISNCATETGFGIYLWMSNNNTINDNILAHNSNGIGIVLGFNNTIANNRILYSSDISGLQLYNSSHNVIKDNLISGCSSGIVLFNSTNNYLLINNITGNQNGVCLAWSSDNIILKNYITYNQKGAWIAESFRNVIYNNNFINNLEQVRDVSLDYPDLNLTASINIWNDSYPSGGNFWSDYTGVDANGDGIGDVPYVIDSNNQDNYPLVASISVFDAGVWNGTICNVDIVTNSTVQNFQVDTDKKTVSFNVSGIDGTAGFCRITIPNTIVQELWHGNYTILLNGEPWSFKNWTDATNTYILINYTHSEHKITIIPELPSTLTLATFMLTTLIATTLWKTKRKHQFP